MEPSPLSPSPALSASAPTVLIVDDTPANLAVLVDHLESSGARVVVAQDGEEALERAALRPQTKGVTP